MTLFEGITYHTAFVLLLSYTCFSSYKHKVLHLYIEIQSNLIEIAAIQHLQSQLYDSRNTEIEKDYMYELSS